MKKRRGSTYRGSPPMLPEAERIAKALLSWFEKHKRDFSFRWITDPYRVLVMEVMLRKTTARQVDEIWPHFIKLFPTPKHLAEANTEEVEKVLAPLGLKQRAKQLQNIARIIIEKWNGKIPKSVKKLQSLPGVGNYIAGCVVSFCYNVKVPLVDSNVKRVFSRLLAKKLVDLKKVDTLRLISETYVNIAPEQDLMRFHYALLDLASMICRPKKPKCESCPLRFWCDFPELRKS